MKDFEEFKQIRENQGFTQVDFAKILGLSRSVVAKIEAGNYKISNRIAEKVISEFPDGVNIIRENYISQRQNHIYKGIVSTRNPVLGKYLEIKVNGEKVNEVKVEDLFFSAQDKEIFEKLISKNQELINVLDSIQDICEMGLLYDNDFYEKADVEYLNETRVRISLSNHFKIIANKHSIKDQSEKMINEIEINLSIAYKILLKCIEKFRILFKKVNKKILR